MKQIEKIPESIRNILDKVKTFFPENPQIYEIFKNCYTNTLNTAVHSMENDTVYVVTGDIPAMWLRDSAASLRPYLIPAKEDKNIADILFWWEWCIVSSCISVLTPMQMHLIRNLMEIAGRRMRQR